MATFPLNNITSEITCDRLVKETLNVGYVDRETEQHAIFKNVNNVYYGSFIGSAKLVGNGKDSSIENYQIEKSTLLSCDFVDLNGEAVGLGEFKENVTTAINDIRENLDGLSTFLSGLTADILSSPFPGFEIETISADNGLCSIWDKDFDLASQTQSVEEAISSIQYALRYAFQKLGKWKYSSEPSAEWEPNVVSGGYQYIRY